MAFRGIKPPAQPRSLRSEIEHKGVAPSGFTGTDVAPSGPTGTPAAASYKDHAEAARAPASLAVRPHTAADKTPFTNVRKR